MYCGTSEVCHADHSDCWLDLRWPAGTKVFIRKQSHAQLCESRPVTHLQDIQHAGHLGEDERLVAAGLQLPQQDGQFLRRQQTPCLPVYALSRRLCCPSTSNCQIDSSCSTLFSSCEHDQMVCLANDTCTSAAPYTQCRVWLH